MLQASTRRKLRKDIQSLKRKADRVNWRSVTFLFGIPLVGFLSAPRTPLYWQTALFSLIFFGASIVGVAAGYHRLWSHKSFRASKPLQVYLAIAGASAVQGSIRWWARDHRAHHRYTDTDKDPYTIVKGFWHAHIGWLLLRRDKSKVGRSNVTDLDNDPVVRWQHRNFLSIMFMIAVIFPICICGFGWQDWQGGIVYAVLIRTFFVHQAMFCVNSLAHWLGDQPYDDTHTPRDHFITAVITFGEGYHNFHHEFPTDYRSAPLWHQYDPTKWFIYICKVLGLAYDLKTFRNNEIQKSILQQKQKVLQRKASSLEWGTPLEDLPVIEWDEFQEQVKDRAQLVAIGGVIYDFRDFIDRHPGGKALIRLGLGKDATALFEGGVYKHSNNAHNILSTMRVAVLRGGMEVEVWKKKST